MGRRALFLDRDGVINRDVGYAGRIDQIHFIPEIFEIARQAHAQGAYIIIVTNQSGIARGYFTESQMHEVMRYICDRFVQEACPVTAYYFCPHMPDAGCACRKPKPGMILQAAEEWGIDLAGSRLIGDRESDLEAGRAAGVGQLLLFPNPLVV